MYTRGHCEVTVKHKYTRSLHCGRRMHCLSLITALLGEGSTVVSLITSLILTREGSEYLQHYWTSKVTAWLSFGSSPLSLALLGTDWMLTGY